MKDLTTEQIKGIIATAEAELKTREKDVPMSPLGPISELIEFDAPLKICRDPCIEQRAQGKYKGRGLYLDSRFNWLVVNDPGSFAVLIAREKQW